MTIIVAILDEPPFCWLDAAGQAHGCDVELAQVALQEAGFADIEFVLVAFEQLIPGVLADRWQVNTGMFVTAERRALVRFTRPIWSVPDGLVVRAEDADRFTSYPGLAADPEARLAVVVGQVQGDSARSAGLPDERILQVGTQDEAVRAVLDKAVDAAASTAIGNRALLRRMADARLAAVDLHLGLSDSPIGAFSLNPANTVVAEALDAQLAVLLGSARHREIRQRHGFAPD